MSSIWEACGFQLKATQNAGGMKRLGILVIKMERELKLRKRGFGHGY